MRHDHYQYPALVYKDRRNFIATTTAIALAAAATIATGATVYSSQKQASTAKKASDAQNAALSAQINASTPVNSAADATALAAKKAKDDAALRAQGYSPTILTSGQGDTSKANTGKTFLGQ